MDYIFDALMVLVAATVTYYIIPYIKSNTTAVVQANLATTVAIAVAAAEQLFASGQGAEKLSYVQNYLAKIGIQVTTEEIESAVYWLTNSITDGLTEQTED